MEKSKVYYCNLYSDSQSKNMPNNVKKLFEKAGFKDLIGNNDQVAIKLHFGEKGNTTYMSPVAVRQVVDKVKEYGGKPFLTDTNTLYSGSRTNSVDHITTAIENGFAYAVVNAPIIIADGLYSRNSEDVSINQKHFDIVKIGGEIYNSSAMIVMSHFKGHEMAGFGGALKNLAMGCATAPGKQMQHSDAKPEVNEDKCIGCSKCAKSCPVSAIHMENKKAKINHDICYGCGECPTVCPTRAVTIQWESDSDIFVEKMAEYAYGAINNKKDKVGFITFVMNVTPLCDCVPWSGRPIAHDIGILASKDPVALDKACYDLVCEEMNHDVFKHAHPNVNGIRVVEYAHEMGMGNIEYELIKL
ncbi:DUF362 domain-containing protein [Paraclostridium bifermentans]|uniref:DUF362 domain-containing protein n=1 Tax=Paraclostridium bifermentans TaxID=1490 RepID=UPI00359C3CCF